MCAGLISLYCHPQERMQCSRPKWWGIPSPVLRGSELAGAHCLTPLNLSMTTSIISIYSRFDHQHYSSLSSSLCLWFCLWLKEAILLVLKDLYHQDSIYQLKIYLTGLFDLTAPSQAIILLLCWKILYLLFKSPSSIYLFMYLCNLFFLVASLKADLFQCKKKKKKKKSIISMHRCCSFCVWLELKYLQASLF